MYYCYCYYDVHRVHEAAHVLTARPGPWPIRCGVLLLRLRLFWVCLGRYPPKTATQRRRGVSSVHPQRYQGFDPTFAQGIILYIIHPRRFAKNVDVGDACSMTFLPYFVARTEPPAQLREVGPDRGHLLTGSCSDVHLHVCRCRTEDEDCCCWSVGSRRQNSTACTGVIFA